MTYAQDNLVYQKPSDEILSLVDVQLAPNILMNNDKSVMILLYRDAYKSIDELSRKEMRLAGLRIDPATNIGSRTTYFNNMRIKHIGGDDQTDKQISGLPAKTKITGFRWSPDYSKIAFTNTSEKGVELWVVDIASASAKKLTDAVVNANMRDAINWYTNQSFTC